MTQEEIDLQELNDLGKALYDTLYMYGDSDEEMERATESAKYQRREVELRNLADQFAIKYKYKPRIAYYQ